MAAADAACVDEGDLGGLTDRAGCCGCLVDRIHLGNWRRCGADREADLDLLVHTVRAKEMDTENKEE